MLAITDKLTFSIAKCLDNALSVTKLIFYCGSILLFAALPSLTQANTAASIARLASQSIVEIEVAGANGLLASGSGFIIDSSGVIVTNYHVIENGDSITIRLASGEEFDRVFVIAHNKRFDLALLKISTVDLPVLPLGSSASVSVGDEVFVLSNPLGLARSFSQGHVGALRVRDGIEILQITAPMSQGSSGGAVLNTEGEVIGVATGVMQEGQNINIAIPVKYVAGLLSEPQQPLSYSEFGQQQWPNFRSSAPSLPARAELSPNVTAAIRELGLDIDEFDFLFDDLSAFDEYDQELVFQLFIMGMGFSREAGYEVYHLDDRRGINRGEVSSFVRHLNNGEYVAIAACDRDCDEMFLVVQSESGWLSGSDTDTSLPYASFSLTASTDVTFQLRMLQCNIEPCFTRLMLMRK